MENRLVRLASSAHHAREEVTGTHFSPIQPKRGRGAERKYDTHDSALFFIKKNNPVPILVINVFHVHYQYTRTLAHSEPNHPLLLAIGALALGNARALERDPRKQPAEEMSL